MSTTVICVLLETLPQARHEEVGMQRQQSSSWGDGNTLEGMVAEAAARVFEEK